MLNGEIPLVSMAEGCGWARNCRAGVGKSLGILWVSWLRFSKHRPPGSQKCAPTRLTTAREPSLAIPNDLRLCQAYVAFAPGILLCTESAYGSIILDNRGTSAHTHTFDDAGFGWRGSGLGNR